MVYGALLARGERYYTDMRRVFEAIEGRQCAYNWLITGWETTLADESVFERNGGRYCWMNGDELAELVEQNSFQWIWACLSGFPKEMSLAEILEAPMPEADVPGLWKMPLTIQHPLAENEIVPFDSSLVVLRTRNREIYDGFRKNFPLSEDLAEYIESR